MILRSLLFLTIFCLCFEAGAQKRPPPPKAPGSAPGNGAGAPNGGGAGFRVVTVPVYSDFKLGQEKSEYDSILISFNKKLVTEKANYPVTLHPRFIGKRLFQLRMKTDLQELDSLPKDIIALFSSKYETPDSSSTGMREIPGNAFNDSMSKDPVKIISSFTSWQFRYYTLSILMTYQAKTNGKFYGSAELTFYGNAYYYELLKQIEEREGH